MGLLGMPEYRGLVDQWREDRERGNVVAGREGSLALDLELNKLPDVEPGADHPDPSKPGLFGALGDLLAGGRREPEVEQEPEA